MNKLKDKGDEQKMNDFNFTTWAVEFLTEQNTEVISKDDILKLRDLLARAYGLGKDSEIREKFL
jgi:hypothetical protein